MSRVRARTGRKRARSRDSKGIVHLLRLRERAIRAQLDEGSHLFADPWVHRLVVGKLYTALLTSLSTEKEIALEFWQAYTHLQIGGSIEELPITLVNPKVLVESLRRILSGDAISLELEKEWCHVEEEGRDREQGAQDGDGEG